jgi:outer membrane lipoprotein-sorting protein
MMIGGTQNRFIFYKCIAFTLLMGLQMNAKAQDINVLLKKVKAKLDQVNDYVAEGQMKTDVAFIKAPAGKMKVYYKRPNKFRLRRDGGISLLPKGGVSVNMNTVLENSDYTAIDGGETVIGSTKVKVAKLLPLDDNSDIVLTTLYIDVANVLILKSVTTTKENGTYDMQMSYGKFAAYGLPDKVSFSFNTKDYKLPKGISMEFDTGENHAGADKLKNKKGKVDIIYSSYIINKGVADSEFK